MPLDHLPAPPKGQVPKAAGLKRESKPHYFVTLSHTQQLHQHSSAAPSFCQQHYILVRDFSQWQQITKQNGRNAPPNYRFKKNPHPCCDLSIISIRRQQSKTVIRNIVTTMTTRLCDIMMKLLLPVQNIYVHRKLESKYH